MKTLLSTVSFLFFSCFLMAQTAEIESHQVTNDKTSSIETKLEANRPLIKNHKLVAAKQIRKFLKKELKYNKVLQDYQQEANIVLKIKISSTGAILDYKIDSSTNNHFKPLVKKAMAKMKNITTREGKYYGPQNLDVKVVFDLDYI